jgi:hypothetical protein
MPNKSPSQTRRLVNAAALGTAAGLLTRNPYIGLGTGAVVYATKFSPIPVGGGRSKRKSKRSPKRKSKRSPKRRSKKHKTHRSKRVRFQLGNH